MAIKADHLKNFITYAYSGDKEEMHKQFDIMLSRLNDADKYKIFKGKYQIILS